MPSEIVSTIRRMAEEGKFDVNGRTDLKLLLLEEDMLLGRLQSL